MIQDDLATGAKAKNEGIALRKEYEEKVSLAKEEGKEITRPYIPVDSATAAPSNIVEIISPFASG